MSKNYLISTGGSGGHVLPATIFHEHLLGEANVIISTDKRGLKYLDKNKFEIIMIDTPKLNNIFFLPISLIIIAFLTIKSFFLLKNKGINKVFSTGGYMSLPVILASRILGLEIFLIEPNHVLGRANKFFLNSCKRIFCYNEKIKNFPEKLRNKIIIIDPLVKKKIYELEFSKKRAEKFTILIVGGSQGANIFNDNLKNSLLKISKNNSIKIIQQTYEKNVSVLKDFYSKNELESTIFTYDKNFINILQQTDLCITRAGASTLAELSTINIPFIAIPLPTSKDNHQYENANFYRNNNCCWILEQNHFEEKIEKLLNNILNDKREYLEKKENLKKLNKKNTWENVNQKILRIINEN
tara:strand:+ start:2409 stop:3473 length:1065 start_codon:yes stop_codon:yes gene_type:complete